MSSSSNSAEDRLMTLMGELMRQTGEEMSAESYGQWAGMAQGLADPGHHMASGSPGAMPVPSGVDEETGMAVQPPRLAGGGGATTGDTLYVMGELAARGAGAGAADALASLDVMDDLLDVEKLTRMANDAYRQSFALLPVDTDPLLAQALEQTVGWSGQGLRAAESMNTEQPARPASVGRDDTRSSTPPSPAGQAYFLPDSGPAPNGASAFDVDRVRKDFPILQRRINGRPLIWLDNGATTQKPRQVIDRVTRFYTHENSNVHRGAHSLAAEATDAYEGARAKVAAFLGAALPEEIVFVRGTTEGINLVANILGQKMLGPGDEILLSEAEHHANIVPWQMIAHQTGAKIRVAPIADSGDLIMEEFARRLNPRTRVAAFTHVSNALGTVMPIEQMTAMAKRYGALVVIDGAQGINHRHVNVQAIGCDFYVFSGHKLFAPTGIGAVYGRKDLWEDLPPWQGGGSMIDKVTFERTTYAGLPNKFEAGTGSLASAVGLGAAIDYLNQLGWEAIERHETDVVEHAVHGLAGIRGLRLIGTPRERAGVISFVIDGVDSREIGRLLDREGIAVRAGHHCAQPVLAHYGLETTVRPAFAFYNTHDEADALITAVNRIASRHRN